jgi:hypothetical protein
VHDAGHLRRRQEHGFFLPFDTHEAETGAVRAHDSFRNFRVALGCGGTGAMRAACGRLLRVTRVFMASA